MDQRTIKFPQRLDESSQTFFQHLEISCDRALLDLSSVRYFDFFGAKLLLNFIQKIIAPNTQTFPCQLSLYVPQPKLAQLLRFMQFDKFISFSNSPTPTPPLSATKKEIACQTSQL